MSTSNHSTPYHGHRPTLSLSSSNSKNSENHVPSRMSMPLSPKTTNALSSDKDTIFQLQLEIQTLKQRLSVTSSTGKNELMELVQEKESVIQAKSRQVSLLTEKFHKISKAFSGMETEVVKLKDSKNHLEEENKKLKRHLNIREKEVTTLVSRCTVQEEKIMQAKESKALEKQLGEVKKQLQESEEKLEQMQLLEKQLAMAHQEKEEIVQQLHALSKDKENLDRHLQQTKEDLQRIINDKDDILETMRKELANMKDLKEEQEKECADLSSQLKAKEHNLSDASQEISSLKEQNIKWNEDVTRLKAEINSLENEMTTLKQNEEHLSKNSQESSDTIAHLKMQLEEKDQFNKKMAEEFNSKLKILKSENEKTKDEYEGMLVESEEQFKELEMLYEKEQMKAEKLKQEIIQATARSLKQDESRHEEIRMLEDNLKAAKTQLAKREQESKSILTDLKREKEKIFALEAQIKVLEQARDQLELEGAHAVEDLRLQLEQATIKYAKLEEEKKFVEAGAKKDSEHFEVMIETLESQFNDMKSDIASKDAQLEQRQSTINTLMKTKTQLEQKIASYRSDLEMINQGYESAKADYENKAHQHREIIEKMVQRHEEEKKSFASDFQELDLFARQTQEQLEEMCTTNETLKQDLYDKNERLSKLTTLNQNLEKQLKESQLSVSMHQNEKTTKSKELETIRRQLEDLRLEKDIEINKHLDALDSERSAKLIAVNKVAELTKKLESEFKDHKKVDALMAENFLLKDKVERQESYLKRKLAKEKATRTITSPITKSTPPPPPIHNMNKPSPVSRSLSESSRS